MITRVLSLAHSKVRPDDFLLADSAFKRKFSTELREVQRRYADCRNELIHDMQSRHELAVISKQRRFSIDPTLTLSTPGDIAKRYIDTKVRHVSNTQS